MKDEKKDNSTAEEPAEVKDAPAEPTAESGNAVESQPAAEEITPEGARKKKSRKRLYLNLFLVVLLALGVYAMFKIVDEIPDANGSFTEVFGKISLSFLFVLIAVVLGIMFLDCTKFAIINKTVLGKTRLSSAVKTSYLGKYYDGITPFASGGQPMQIYYLHGKGISGGDATAIVLIRYYACMVAWVTVSAALMIYGTVAGVLNSVETDAGRILLMVTGWVGVGINLVIPLFITFFLLFPKFMYKFTGFLISAGKKLHIVRDKEKTMAKALKVVEDFRHSFRVMLTTPFNLIMLLLVCFVEAFLTYTVPYFVMKMFSCDVQGQFFVIMSANAFASIGVSFIPTPGNTGVIESWSALAFSATAGSTLGWSVLMWRFCVYYVYMIVGIIISVRDIIKKNLKKYRTPEPSDEPSSEEPPETPPAEQTEKKE